MKGSKASGCCVLAALLIVTMVVQAAALSEAVVSVQRSQAARTLSGWVPAKRMQSAGVHRALLQIIKKEAPTVKKAPAVQVVKQAAVQKVVEVVASPAPSPPPPAAVVVKKVDASQQVVVPKKQKVIQVDGRR